MHNVWTADMVFIKDKDVFMESKLYGRFRS